MAVASPNGATIRVRVLNVISGDVIYAAEALASATIKDLRLRSITTLESSSLDVYTPIRFIEPDYFGLVKVPADYRISFVLIPYETSETWGSILHFTQSGNHDISMPSLWFLPGSTQIFFVYSGSDSVAELIPTSLPLDAETKISIETQGGVIQLRLNETTILLKHSPNRPSGPSILYLSDPMYGLPNAQLGLFKIESLQRLTPVSTDLLLNPRTVTSRYFGLVDIPKDYTVSFEITPTAISQALTNLFLVMGVLLFKLGRCIK